MRDDGLRIHGLGVGLNRQRKDVIEAYSSFEGSPATARRKLARSMRLESSAVRLIRSPGFRCEVTAGARGKHHAATGSGTVGGFVQDRRFMYALSNNHVFGLKNAAVSNDDLISPVPRTVFGGFERLIPLNLPPALNSIDAAIGWIHDATPVNFNYAPPNGSLTAERDMRVVKMGGRTGATSGRVTSVASTAQVNFRGLGLLNFRRVVRIQGAGGAPFTLPGDSGSFVRDRVSNSVVGLHFAGDGVSTSFSCHIKAVLEAFRVEITDGETAS
jgi:hypothetical protein